MTDPAICRQSVLSALETGYRLIDTAACYGDEQTVGEVIIRSYAAHSGKFCSRGL